MVIAPRAKTFAEALEVTAEVYHSAGAIMGERGLLQGVADEGGWWPAFSSNEEALETLMRAIERVTASLSASTVCTPDRSNRGFRRAIAVSRWIIA